MANRLYVIPGSHPSAAVEAALALKSIPYRRIDRLPVVHRVQGRLTYGARTVPGLILDGGEKLAGSRAIMRRLDEIVAQPALYPADPAARARVEEADRWGDEVLQPRVRRITWAILKRRPPAMALYAAGAKLPVPIAVTRPALGLVARVSARLHRESDVSTRADLHALVGDVDRIDGWIAEGVLGRDQPNAADLQIGAAVALAVSLGDLAPLFQGRPAAALARYVAAVPGEAPAGVLPSGWIPSDSTKR